MVIKNSELILNADGSIYHLGVKPGELAADIITVGDPRRVEKVSSRFDEVIFSKEKREFATVTGRMGNKFLSVISTGIGTDNIDIVFNEIDALFNIDFETRQVKADHTRLRFYRIGTSGSINSGIGVDSFVISQYGLGIDGIGYYYDSTHSELESRILEHVGQIDARLSKVIMPYCAISPGKLVSHFPDDYTRGITLTATGFYGPQGRELRLTSRFLPILDKIQGQYFEGIPYSNLEMETATMYLLGRLLGHEAVSLNVILANRVTGEFSHDTKKAVSDLIDRSLGVIVSL